MPTRRPAAEAPFPVALALALPMIFLAAGAGAPAAGLDQPAAGLDQPAAGQDEGRFDGEILLGYRTVDVGGAERKFLEDVDEEDGPVLFRLGLELVPAAGLRGVVDRIEIDLWNVGASNESLRLGARRFGAWDLRWDRRASRYFYEDLVLPPELADARSSTGGDFHHFDVERVRDRASLTVTPTAATRLTFGFDRTTRRGESTTTLDVSRDEFELDRPIDEEYETSRVGFSYAWDRATLLLEERLREVENRVEIFLPGFSEGESPGPATLDFFFLDQPYDSRRHEHAAKLLARPSDRLEVALSVELHDLELDVTGSERSRGVGFSGTPFTTDLAGAGSIERDHELYDLDLTYRLGDRWALVASVDHRTLDQDGAFPFGPTDRRGRWEIDTTAYSAGVELFLARGVTLSAGLSAAERDAASVASQDDERFLGDVSTGHDGYFATAAWRPGRAGGRWAGLDLSASVEADTYDDPFTLVSPSDRTRVRLSGRYRWTSGLSAALVYDATEVDNDLSGWRADATRAAARVGYRRGRLELDLGYALHEADREIDQLVNGSTLFPIDYRASAEIVDGRVRWEASERLAVGGSARLYDNAGSFALEVEDLRAYAELSLAEGYVASVALRTLDYDEERFDFDDYDADVLELAVGYRW